MQKIAVLLILLVSIPAIAQEKKDEMTSETTTYYLVRHAEKDRSDKENKNPDLTADGKERASNWSAVFKKVKFDLVYSTIYNRTLQTAAPTAMAQGIEVKSYNPRDLYSKEFQKETSGKTVLVVGHSNTTPAFVNAILGENKFENMDDSDNGSLFIVTVNGNTKSVQVLTIN